MVTVLATPQKRHCATSPVKSTPWSRRVTPLMYSDWTGRSPILVSWGVSLASLDGWVGRYRWSSSGREGRLAAASLLAPSRGTTTSTIDSRQHLQPSEIQLHLLRSLKLTPSTPAVPNCCCSNGLAPYWSNPSFLIFDIRALWRSVLSARMSQIKMMG